MANLIISLNNDSRFIDSLTLNKLGHYAGFQIPTYVSKPNPPRQNVQDWITNHHPLYGICHHFELSENLEEILNKSLLAYVKININFSKINYEQESKIEKLGRRKAGFMNLQMTIDETEESLDLDKEIRRTTREFTPKIDPNASLYFTPSLEQIQLEHEDSLDEDLVEDTEKNQNDLIIFVYQKNSFLSTHQLLKLNGKSRTYYDLKREIIGYVSH